MISLHYTSHTKAYNTIYTACNIVEAIYSFTIGTTDISKHRGLEASVLIDGGSPINAGVLRSVFK